MMTSAWYKRALDDANWQLPRVEERDVESDIRVSSWPVKRLGELVVSVDKAGVAQDRPPLITPRDIEPETGDQVPHERAELQPVFQMRRQLLEHDILLPRSRAVPAVLATEAHAPFAFSTGFIPLRVNPDLLDARYLWMLLCSSRGIRARANVSAGALDWDAVARLGIAVPPLVVQRRQFVPLPTVRWASADSRWWTADLRRARTWRWEPLETPEGTQLRDIAHIRNGDVEEADLFAVPSTSRVPVLTTIDGAAGVPGGWATVPLDKISNGFEVALSPYFPFRACRVPEGWAAERRFLVVRVDQSAGSGISEFVDGLVDWFNSAPGSEAVAAVASGSVLPRVTAASLGRVIVPDAAALFKRPSEPLAVRLEHALELL